MKILIDCTNLKVGGGIQVATSFINDLNSLKDISDSFVVVLPPQMKDRFDRNAFSSKIYFIDLPDRPLNKLRITKLVKDVVIKHEVSKIFSVFGPLYYKSKLTTIVGFAYGHYIYRDSPYYKIISFKEKIKLFLMRIAHTYFFNKNSDVLIFETEDARTRYVSLLSFRKKTFVVSNTVNSIFLDKEKWQHFDLELKSDDSRVFRILCMGVNYPHKNFKMISDIIDILHPKGISFKFFVTTTFESLGFKPEYKKYIECVGKVELEKVPSLYSQMDIVFMPSLLEIFSVTYIESMHMGKPVVAADLSFAHGLCGEAALYFESNNAVDASNKILTLIENEELRNQLVAKGYQNILRYGTSLDRTKKYLKIIKDA